MDMHCIASVRMKTCSVIYGLMLDKVRTMFLVESLVTCAGKFLKNSFAKYGVRVFSKGSQK